jgi:hypothetical protein
MTVAPADLQLECCARHAWTWMSLQNPDKARETLHEGLASCRHEGLWFAKVAGATDIMLSIDMVTGGSRSHPPVRLRSQALRMLAQIALERGDLEGALDFAQRAKHEARKDYAENPKDEEVEELSFVLMTEAEVLEALDRLDEAIILDNEWEALKLGESRENPGAVVRKAMKHVDAGEEAVADQLLRGCVKESSKPSNAILCSELVKGVLKPHLLLAELLERRGTEEELAEARTLREGAAQQVAKIEARVAAGLEETRAAAVEAARQWREKRSKATEAEAGEEGQQEGGGGEKREGKSKRKNKAKKKGRRGKAKVKGTSSAALPAIEGEPPQEPAGEGAEGAEAVDGAAVAEAEQLALVGESQPLDEKEEMEECAICLQDLELEEDEEPWVDDGGEGEALVVLRCGHRFHAICGDMWCAKCADKGWGVTCPRCRAPYTLLADE